jgi:hypothetical protein
VEISPNAGIQSALQSGKQGFQKASDDIAQASQSIANRTVLNSNDEAVATGNQQTSSVADDLVQLSVGENQANANVRSIQTTNEVLGTFIDEMV